MASGMAFFSRGDRATHTEADGGGHAAVCAGCSVPRSSLLLQSRDDNFSLGIRPECGIRSPKVLSLLISFYVLVFCADWWCGAIFGPRSSDRLPSHRHWAFSFVGFVSEAHWGADPQEPPLDAMALDMNVRLMSADYFDDDSDCVWTLVCGSR